MITIDLKVQLSVLDLYSFVVKLVNCYLLFVKHLVSLSMYYLCQPFCAQVFVCPHKIKHS